MNKILINLFVPAINEYYDIFIPNFLSIREICLLLGKAIEELSNNQYVLSGEELLCSVERRKILNPNQNFMDYGIQNGEHLLLF